MQKLYVVTDLKPIRGCIKKTPLYKWSFHLGEYTPTYMYGDIL